MNDFLKIVLIVGLILTAIYVKMTYFDGNISNNNNEQTISVENKENQIQEDAPKVAKEE